MLNFSTLWQRADSLANARRPRMTRLRSNPFIRSVGILSGGSAFGHLFTLAAAPILTRIYGPDDFGALGLFTNYLSVMGVAVALQYATSIVSAENEPEAAYLTFASLLIALPMSVLSGIILWGLIRFSALGFGSLVWYSPLFLTLSMFFVGIFTALRYWCLRQEKFGQVSHGVIVQSAGRAISQVVFGALGFHTAGLIAGETVGRATGMSRMIRGAWPVLKSYAATFHLDEFLQALRRNRKFPLYSLPSSFLDALCLSISLPLLIRLYGVSIGGYYSLVWKAIAVPTVLITLAVADAFHSRLAICARETPGRIGSLFRRTSLTLLRMGIIPASILFFWGVPFFRLVFGEKWGLSGTMASIIAPWYLAQFVVSPVSRVVFVLSGQETKLIWDVASLASVIGIFSVAQHQGMAPLQTIKILSVVNVGLFAFYYLLLLRIIAQFQKTHSGQTQTA
jgi:lipopolysaccharide exporter